MAKLLVGTYRSRADAADARQRLLDRGIDASRIRLIGPGAEESRAAGATTDLDDWNEAPADQRRLSNWIEMMFSGLLPEKAEQQRYEHLVRTGATLVAVKGVTDQELEHAKPDLALRGSVDEHVVEAEAWDPRRPDVTPLPNAPSGWNEAIEGERSMPAGDVAHDPARPEGVVRGANELGSTHDRERIERRSR